MYYLTKFRDYCEMSKSPEEIDPYASIEDILNIAKDEAVGNCQTIEQEVNEPDVIGTVTAASDTARTIKQKLSVFKETIKTYVQTDSDKEKNDKDTHEKDDCKRCSQRIITSTNDVHTTIGAINCNIQRLNNPISTSCEMDIPLMDFVKLNDFQERVLDYLNGGNMIDLEAKTIVNETVKGRNELAKTSIDEERMNAIWEEVEAITQKAKENVGATDEDVRKIAQQNIADFKEKINLTILEHRNEICAKMTAMTDKAIQELAEETERLIELYGKLDERNDL